MEIAVEWARNLDSWDSAFVGVIVGFTITGCNVKRAGLMSAAR